MKYVTNLEKNIIMKSTKILTLLASCAVMAGCNSGGSTQAAAPAPQNLSYAVGDAGEFYLSTQAGEWSQVTKFDSLPNSVSCGATGGCYALLDSGLYSSNPNNPSDWKLVSGGSATQISGPVYYALTLTNVVNSASGKEVNFSKPMFDQVIRPRLHMVGEDGSIATASTVETVTNSSNGSELVITAINSPTKNDLYMVTDTQGPTSVKTFAAGDRVVVSSADGDRFVVDEVPEDVSENVTWFASVCDPIDTEETCMIAGSGGNVITSVMPYADEENSELTAGWINGAFPHVWKKVELSHSKHMFDAALGADHRIVMVGAGVINYFDHDSEGLHLHQATIPATIDGQNYLIYSVSYLGDRKFTASAELEGGTAAKGLLNSDDNGATWKYHPAEVITGGEIQNQFSLNISFSSVGNAFKEGWHAVHDEVVKPIEDIGCALEKEVTRGNLQTLCVPVRDEKTGKVVGSVAPEVMEPAAQQIQKAVTKIKTWLK